jgi:hypothetical protein
VESLFTAFLHTSDFVQTQNEAKHTNSDYLLTKLSFVGSKLFPSLHPKFFTLADARIFQRSFHTSLSICGLELPPLDCIFLCCSIWFALFTEKILVWVPIQMRVSLEQRELRATLHILATSSKVKILWSNWRFRHPVIGSIRSHTRALLSNPW